MRHRLKGPCVGVLLLGLLATACGNEQTTTSTTPDVDASTTTAVETSSTRPGTTSVPDTTTTSPPNTSEPLPTDVADLLVVGDWGSGTLPQGAVAGEMMRYAGTNDVAAILTTGDNLLSDDWEFVVEPYGWAARADIPFWIAWGDDDSASESRVDAVDAAFGEPPRWTVHQWGVVKIVILDSTQVDSEEQSEFLSDTLAVDADPTIVVAHHGPFGCDSSADSAQAVEEWVPLFDDDVFLVLSGNERNYQRFEGSGFVSVGTGGGGAGLSDLAECGDDDPDRVAGASVHHFVALEHGEQVVGKAIDVNGEIVDGFAMPLP